MSALNVSFYFVWHFRTVFHAHKNISLTLSLSFILFCQFCLCLVHVCQGEQHYTNYSRRSSAKRKLFATFFHPWKKTVGSYRLIRYTLLGSEHFAREGEGLLEQVEYDRNKPLYNAYTLLIHQLQNIHKLNNESAVLDISDPISLRSVINPHHICSSVLCWHGVPGTPQKSHLNLNFVFVFKQALTQCPLFL